MPPDATDTKRRILSAAREEFSRYGLAGARVDRIAEAAEANKRSLYVHFGTKEELFDIVVATALLELADAVPFDVGNLPQYAAHLLDALEQRPDIGRLTAWAVLERPQPIEAELASYRAKVDAMREAQSRGDLPADHQPVVLLAMIIGIVASWYNASWSLRELAGSPEPALIPAGYRDAVINAVRALVDRAGPAVR